METGAIGHEADSGGSRLNKALALQRTFMENVFSLMRFLESEFTRRGRSLIRNGGYSVTRDGLGTGLSNFSSNDWIANQAGIAFVAEGKSVLVQGATNTQIPQGGLELLLFQVRWLDKAPVEPVVWVVNALVEAEGSVTPRKWEEYQSIVFKRLEPGPEADGSERSIGPIRATLSGTAVVVTGTYAEIPVASISTQEHVMKLLVEPVPGPSGNEAQD